MQLLIPLFTRLSLSFPSVAAASTITASRINNGHSYNLISTLGRYSPNFNQCLRTKSACGSRSCYSRLSSVSSVSSIVSRNRKIRGRMSPVQDASDSPVVPAQVPVPTTSTSTDAEVQKELKEPLEIEMEPTPKLFFVKMTEHASSPTKGSKFAAGYDLKSAYDAVVPKRGSCLVKTDIQIQLPSGTYGRVAPRSGLALKNKIDVGAGVIDEDYRGNIGVILFNHADEDFIVTKGDRIAQLICERILYPEAVEVESLVESERGAGGFGSTGGVKKMKLDDNGI